LEIPAEEIMGTLNFESRALSASALCGLGVGTIDVAVGTSRRESRYVRVSFVFSQGWAPKMMNFIKDLGKSNKFFYPILYEVVVY